MKSTQKVEISKSKAKTKSTTAALYIKEKKSVRIGFFENPVKIALKLFKCFVASYILH